VLYKTVVEITWTKITTLIGFC